MNDLPWLPFEAESVLRAMLSVASVGGHRVPLPVERELVLSVQRHVLHTALDVDALDVRSAHAVDELARDPARRTRLVRAAALVPYVSLEAEIAKIAVVDALAIRIGVAPGALREIHRVRELHLRRLLLDHLRRGAVLLLTVHTSAQVRSIVEALRRHRGDDALAARYRGLRALAAGTLGRALYDLHRAHGLPLPGEPGAIDETLVRHDVLRVLGGFHLDAAGDLALAGFAAGVAGTPRGHEATFELLAEAHAGAQLRGMPAAGAELDLAGALHAHELGPAAATALGDGWDLWSLAGEDLDELRRRCGLAEPARVRRRSSESERRPARASRAA